MAKRLPLGEGAAHALFHPSPSARPFLAHAFETVDHFGHLAMARSGGAAIECDEGIAGQNLLSGSLLPAGPLGQEIGVRGQDRRRFPHLRLRRGHEREAHGRAADAVAGEPDRQGPGGRAHEQVLDAIRADDDVPDAKLLGQRKGWWQP